MKKITKSAFVLGIASIALLGSCNNRTTTTTKGNTGTARPTDTSKGDSSIYVVFKGEEYAEGSTNAVELTVNEGVAILVPHIVGEDKSSITDFTFNTSNAEVVAVNETAGSLSAKKAGTATVTVALASDASKVVTFNITVKDAVVSSGLEDFTAITNASGEIDYDEKARILATLEKYAVENYLTGITLFSNGSRVLYNNRYKPLPTSYVTGYGWGTMREGSFQKDSAGNVIRLPNPLGSHGDYYTIGTTSLPTHANAMNASGSDVSTVYGYISNSYYETRLNSTNDGYEWYGKLANDKRPLPIDEKGNVIKDDDAAFTNKRWRIHVKTGSNYTYRTASTKTKGTTAISSFNNRAIELNDYITPFKLMLTNWNGQYRGSELTKGVSGFEGAAAYFNATSTNNTGDGSAIYNSNYWNQYIGDESGNLLDKDGKPTGKRGNIIIGRDDDGDYIEFNLLQPCTQFYAMYYLSSSLYSPLPESFIKVWGPKDLGKSPDGFTEVDTMLSSGPYYIENWDSVGKTGVTFKKNDTYFYQQDADGDFASNPRKVYNMAGIQYNSVQQSSDLKQKFLTGQVDSYSPNKDDLKSDMKNMSGTSSSGVGWTAYQTKGDSNFKLNINASTAEQWKNRFGKYGTVKTHTFDDPINQNGYSGIKEYMSDKHFLNFLSYALDRETICTSRGMTPTQEYFSDNYIIDPEKGTSYNSTDAHKAVLADRYNSTYGYNKEAAKSELKQVFDTTLLKLSTEGKLKTGTAEDIGKGSGEPGTDTNPYVVPIDMFWMNPSDLTDYNDVFDSITEIFNEVASGIKYKGRYKLYINMPTPSSDYNKVYDRMKEGLFDIGFGAISGNDLNPLNFVEVLKSDNSSGFTLNWGPDTSVVSDEIVYNGKKWSFDSLWNAANTGVVLTNEGAIANVQNTSTGYTAGLYKYQSKGNESVTYKISFKQLISAGAVIKEITLVANGKSESFTLGKASEGKTQLNINESTNWEGELTVGKKFNMVEDETGTEVKNNVVSLQVNYTITKDGKEHNFSTTLSLLTYTGVLA